MSGLPDGDATRPATIHDVAARAGVAASTVSRALSTPGRVNFRTREKIEKAAKELNYIPSSQARALSSGRTGAVALLVPDITNPFYFDIIRGTQLQLKAAGYTQLLIDTEESAEVEMSALRQLRKSADGVIFSASRLTDEALAAAAKEFPAVTINRCVDGVASVVIDTPTATAQALNHLVSLGHRTIAYVAGPATSWPNRLRLDALRAAAESHGVTLLEVGSFAPNTRSGAAAADAALYSQATACIVFNDLIAIGMLQRFAERGISVPAQMSVVGCDDIFGADFCHPPLTTVTAPVEQAGRVATTLLLGQINPSYAAQQRMEAVLGTHLTVRSSTGPAPVATAAPVAVSA
jgi:LacI family transcriptional regulator, repressor for deo operon, udp, cdd, tsx, nupC, and nupG